MVRLASHFGTDLNLFIFLLSFTVAKKLYVNKICHFNDLKIFLNFPLFLPRGKLRSSYIQKLIRNNSLVILGLKVFDPRNKKNFYFKFRPPSFISLDLWTSSLNWIIQSKLIWNEVQKHRGERAFRRDNDPIYNGVLRRKIKVKFNLRYTLRREFPVRTKVAFAAGTLGPWAEHIRRDCFSSSCGPSSQRVPYGLRICGWLFK